MTRGDSTLASFDQSGFSLTASTPSKAEETRPETLTLKVESAVIDANLAAGENLIIGLFRVQSLITPT